MEKTIKIGNKEVKMKTSGGTPRMYRNEFNRDIFLDMAEFENAVAKKETFNVEMFECMAWCFAKKADPTIPPIEEWLDQFETFDVYAIIPDLVEMWAHDNVITSRLKKKAGRSTEK